MLLTFSCGWFVGFDLHSNRRRCVVFKRVLMVLSIDMTDAIGDNGWHLWQLVGGVAAYRLYAGRGIGCGWIALSCCIARVRISPCLSEAAECCCRVLQTLLQNNKIQIQEKIYFLTYFWGSTSLGRNLLCQNVDRVEFFGRQSDDKLRHGHSVD